MAKDSFEATMDLSKAMQLAADSAEGLGVAFGELSDGSKAWNIASRILSGSGLWKLQNRIRAVSGMMHMYNTHQTEAAKAAVKSAEANTKLRKSYKKMTEGAAFSIKKLYGMSKKQQEMFKKSEPYQLYKQFLEENLDVKGMGKGAAKRSAQAKVRKTYGDAATGIKGALDAHERGLLGGGRAMRYIRKGELTDKGGNLRKGEWLSQDSKWFYRRQKKTWARRWRFIKDRDYRARKNAPLQKKLNNMKEVVGRFFQVGLSFAMKGLYFFLIIATAITAIVLFIKNMNLKESMYEVLKPLELAFSGVVEILKGIFGIFKAAFTGDFGLLATSLGKIFSGLFKVVIGLFVGVVTFIVAMIGGLIKGMLNTFIQVVNKLPFVNIKHKFAKGGVSPGGMALVGERGPELVNLPRGARVYSNAESRRMGGNSIHVHINGRVGASDAEIRDIANKVAREINLRMNRTGATAGRF